MVNIPTTERQFYNTQPKANALGMTAEALLPAAQQYKETLLGQQKVKIDTNITKARIEIDDFANKWRLANQANPDNPEAKKQFQIGVSDILNRYGSQIDPIAKMEWGTTANRLRGAYDISNNQWALNQRAENAKLDVAENIRLNLDMAFNAGLAGNELGGLLDLDRSYLNLENYASKNMGETEARKLLETYKSDFTTNYVNGLIAKNPQAAIDFLDNEGNQLAIKFPRKAKALRDIAEKQLISVKKQYNQQLKVDRQYAYNQYIFNPNKTLEDLEEYRANFEPDMSEKKYEKMADMINSGNPNATTVFENYSEAMKRIHEIANMPDTTLANREDLFKAAADFYEGIVASNQDGKFDESDRDELRDKVNALVSQKAIKDVVKDMPDLSPFKKIINYVGIMGASSSLPFSSIAIKEVGNNIAIQEDIKNVAKTTMNKVLAAYVSGDVKAGQDLYKQGLQAAIRKKYWNIPEIQDQELVPDETIINIGGTPYLFKGYGAEDILVEVKE